MSPASKVQTTERVRRELRVVSFNIQAAIGAQAPSHYVTRLHRQFLHVKAKDAILKKVGKAIEPYDIACLQEIDLGGRRSGFKSQVDGLFEATSFTDAAYQENRVVRRISRHGNLILTRDDMAEVHDLKLPARMGGRGALIGCFPLNRTEYLTVVNLHLSLGAEDQTYQLEHLADELEGHSHIVMCGDFNARVSAPAVTGVMKALKLKSAGTPEPSYPSWQPRQAIDHILVSRHIEVEDYGVLDVGVSDHLPVAATIRV